MSIGNSGDRRQLRDYHAGGRREHRRAERRRFVRHIRDGSVEVNTFSGALARLPKAGVWMVWVKRLFALLMIGAAEYYFVSMGQVLL